MLTLDHRSPIPLRAQVEQLLRDMLRQPEFGEGALLPDELTLAARLGVSRGTIRAGLTKLVFEGLLERRAGVGTRVARGKAESGIMAWRSFTREMARKGIQVQTFQQQFTRKPASDDAARALKVSRRALVWRLDRLRGWGGQPVLHSSSWFHPRLALTGNEDFTKPLYEVVESETGAVAANAREELLAIAANAAMARLLQVPRHTPLLLRRHTVYDRGNRPIEFAEVQYVSSRFTLTLDLRREGE
jgi:GntR family transcriptional regulator